MQTSESPSESEPVSGSAVVPPTPERGTVEALEPRRGPTVSYDGFRNAYGWISRNAERHKDVWIG